jgi:hypothetical protein
LRRPPTTARQLKRPVTNSRLPLRPRGRLTICSTASRAKFWSVLGVSEHVKRGGVEKQGQTEGTHTIDQLGLCRPNRAERHSSLMSEKTCKRCAGRVSCSSGFWQQGYSRWPTTKNSSLPMVTTVVHFLSSSDGTVWVTLQLTAGDKYAACEMELSGYSHCVAALRLDCMVLDTL